MPSDDPFAQQREQDEHAMLVQVVELLNSDPTAKGIYDSSGVLRQVITVRHVPDGDGGEVAVQVIHHLPERQMNVADWEERRTFDLAAPLPSASLPAFMRSEIHDVAVIAGLRRERTEATPGLLTRQEFLARHDIAYDYPGERSLTAAERLFMLRDAGRIEAELRWLVANDAMVCRAWQEAKRAGLSETTAAEMALICLARENEDLRRAQAKQSL